MDISNLKVQDGFPDNPALTSFPVIIFPILINDDSAFTTVEDNCLEIFLTSLSLSHPISDMPANDAILEPDSTIPCYQDKAAPSLEAVASNLAPYVTLAHFHFNLHMAAGGILLNMCRPCRFSARNHQWFLGSPLVKVQILQ